MELACGDVSQGGPPMRTQLRQSPLSQIHNVKSSVRRRVQRHYTYLKEAGMAYASKEVFPELPHALR